MSSADLKTGARLGLTLVGAAFAGPLGAAFGTALGSFLLPPDAIELTGPRLDTLKVSLSRYGDPIKVVYGSMRIGGAYVWATDIIEKVSKKTESAKGGQKTTTRTFSYFGNFAIDLCESPAAFPITAVTEIFFNGNKVVDRTLPTVPSGTSGFAANLIGALESLLVNIGSTRIQLGEEDQLPDPLIESFIGVGNTPAGRGVCRLVFDRLPLENVNNIIPQVTAVVTTAGTNIFPSVDIARNFDKRDWYMLSDQVHAVIIRGGVADQITKINTITREIVADQVELDIGDSPFGIAMPQSIPDALGRVYAESISTTIFQYSTDTYELLGKTINNAFGARAMSAITGFGPFSNRVFACGDTGVAEKILILDATPDPTGNLGKELHVLLDYTMEDYGFPTGGFGGPIRTIIRDNLGHIWGAIADGSGNTDLVQFSNSLGTPLNIFRLTGIDFANAAGGATHPHIGFCAKTNSIAFLATDSTLRMWDITAAALDSRTLTFPSAILESTGPQFRNGSFDGFFFFQLTNNDWVQVDLVTMRIVNTFDFQADWGTSDLDDCVTIPHAGALACTTSASSTVFVYLDRATAGGVTLEAILDDLTDRTKVYTSAADSDASEHSGVTVPGFVVAQRTRIINAAAELGQFYNFGFVESDHLIKFPGRGKASVLTLTDDDLGVSDDGSGTGSKLVIKRVQEAELPLRVETTYLDATFDYQQQMQAATRIAEIVETERVISRTYALSLDNDEARQRTEIALHTKWMDRNQYGFSTFPRHVKLDPGDSVIMSVDSKFHAVTLMSTDMGANGLIECSGVGFPLANQAEADALQAQIYTLSGTLGGTAEDFSTTVPSVPNPPRVEYIDSPLFRDLDAPGRLQIGMYVAMQGSARTGDWPGGIIDRSVDNSIYADFAFYPLEQEGVIGFVEGKVAADALGDAARWTVFDDVNTVDINIGAGITLVSVTDLEIFNGNNVFMIGNELVQAGTVADQTGGIWRLSHLLRGRRGTEWFIPDHVVHERVAFLGDLDDADRVIFKRLPFADRNDEFFYKAFSLDDPLGVSVNRAFTNTGRTLQPYAPAAPTAVISGSDWSLGATRRTRIGGEFPEGTITDTPLSETIEEFEVDIMDSAGTVVKRTITSTASGGGSVVTNSVSPAANVTALYTFADQETDFGSGPPSPYPLTQIITRWYQISGEVGRGFVRETSFDVA